MSIFNKKLQGCKEIRKYRPFTEGKEDSNRIAPKEAQMLELVGKDVKTTVLNMLIVLQKTMKKKRRDFPSSPMVKTPHSQCRGAGSNPVQGTKIPTPHSMAKKKKKKRKIKGKQVLTRK